MEHAIEKAARAEAEKRHGGEYVSGDDMLARRSFAEGAKWAVEHLRAQGLIAPAPLTEEWAARYVNGGGAIRRTRDEAEAELDRMTRDSRRPRIDEPPAPEIAGIVRRYVTDWEHA